MGILLFKARMCLFVGISTTSFFFGICFWNYFSTKFYIKIFQRIIGNVTFPLDLQHSLLSSYEQIKQEHSCHGKKHTMDSSILRGDKGDVNDTHFFLNLRKYVEKLFSLMKRALYIINYIVITQLPGGKRVPSPAGKN